MAFYSMFGLLYSGFAIGVFIIGALIIVPVSAFGAAVLKNRFSLKSIVSTAWKMGLLGVVFGVNTPQAESLSVLHQGIAHDALYDVCFKGPKGYAVGVAGTVLASDDGGLTWTSQDSGVPNALLGIDCRSDSIIAVGQNGTILRSEGGGEWVRVESGSEQRLLSVSANRAGIVVAVGGFGSVLISRDEGVSWETLSFDWEALLNDFVEPHIYDASVDDDGTILIAGEFELILRSNDQGQTWETVNKGDSSLFALKIRDGGKGFAVGQNGRVIKTDDGGLSWKTLNVGTAENLLDVWSSDKQVFITGIRTLLRSDDDGQTWDAITEGDVSVTWYQSIEASNTASSGVPVVVMVGHSGRIIQIN